LNSIPLDVYNIIAIRKPKSVCENRIATHEVFMYGYELQELLFGLISVTFIGVRVCRNSLPALFVLYTIYCIVSRTTAGYNNITGTYVRSTKREDTWRRRSFRRGITLVTYYIIIYGSIVQQSMLSNCHQWPFYFFS